MKVIKHCAVCGKEFNTTEFNLSRGYGKYCSKECRLQALKGNTRIHNKNVVNMRIDITNDLKRKFDEMYNCKYSDGTHIGYDAIAMYMELAMICKGGNAKTEVQGTCRFNVIEPYNNCKFDRYKCGVLLDLLQVNNLIRITGSDNTRTIAILREVSEKDDAGKQAIEK